MLVAYRKNCSAHTPAGQLVLPESLKLLPVYTNCLARSDIVSGTGKWTVITVECSSNDGWFVTSVDLSKLIGIFESKVGYFCSQLQGYQKRKGT